MVVKRSGEKHSFDIEKIRKQLKPAFNKTGISTLEFEAQLNFDTHKNIKSSRIQEALINQARNNISINEPNWNIVAGRLASHQMLKSVWKHTKIDIKEFGKHLEYLMRNNYYRKDILCDYNKEEIEKLSKYIKKERDYDLILSQIMILSDKYLIKNKSKHIIEYPSTADMTNSMILSSVEEDKVGIAKEYYDMLSTYILSLGTPFKSNMRRPNGNTSSCFVGESGDSNNQLFKGFTDKGTISKQGGGIGWDFSKIRPGGSSSKNIPKSNIINKWLKIVNDIAVAVNQRGIRKGAITPALSWWHLDILSFIEMKSELNGELRDKCFDLFPQVVVDNYFIDAYINKEDVYLFDQYEFKNLTKLDITELIDDDLYNAHVKAKELIETGKLKHYIKISAKHIWKRFLETWIETGDFYITHKDNLNISNYLKPNYANSGNEGLGIAKCSNLCVESFSLSKAATKWKIEANADTITTTETDGITHSCNLISVNIGNILNDEELLQKACYNAVRMLDASVDLGTMPIEEANISSQLLRNIGVGQVGTADWMAYNNLTYCSEKGKLALEKVTEKMTWYCYNASVDLAKEKGAYPAYNKANYDIMIGKTPEELTQRSKITGNDFDWVKLREDIRTHGIRNMLLMAFAPNTSSGLCQGVVSSYLPVHTIDGSEKLGGMIIPVLPKYIKTRPLGYKTKFQYTAQDIIEVTKRLQYWIDTGISMEIPINSENTDIKKISDSIIDGFKNKTLKAVYYSLTIDGKTLGCVICGN